MEGARTAAWFAALVFASLALVVPVPGGRAVAATASETEQAAVDVFAGDGREDDPGLAATLEDPNRADRQEELRRLFPDLDFGYFAADLIVPAEATSRLARQAKSRKRAVKAFCQAYAGGGPRTLQAAALEAALDPDPRGRNLQEALICPSRLPDTRVRGATLSVVQNGLNLVGAGDAVASGSCRRIDIPLGRYDEFECATRTFADPRVSRRLRDALRQAARQEGCLLIRLVQPTRESKQADGPSYLAIGSLTHDVRCMRPGDGV